MCFDFRVCKYSIHNFDKKNIFSPQRRFNSSHKYPYENQVAKRALGCPGHTSTAHAVKYLNFTDVLNTEAIGLCRVQVINACTIPKLPLHYVPCFQLDQKQYFWRRQLQQPLLRLLCALANRA